jgi:prephenate dehydratase
MKISVSGEPGSFSEEAGMLYAQREGIDAPELIFSVDMEGALRDLNEGNSDRAIFPVVNSRGGLVRPAFHAMGNYTFKYVDELWMEIYQCLMVKPGTKVDDITEIASHSQALAQCSRHIDNEFPDAKKTNWDDTAKAARDLAEGALPASTAVIASSRAAHRYGLELIEKGIQDSHPNLTTFIVAERHG